jgi:hypothetical protein
VALASSISRSMIAMMRFPQAAIGGPRGGYKTPALHHQINAALETVCMMTEIRRRVGKLGYDVIGACPGDQARLRISRRMADAGCARRRFSMPSWVPAVTGAGSARMGLHDNPDECHQHQRRG